MATIVAANAVTPPRRQHHQCYVSKLESTNHLPSHASTTSSPSTEVGATFSTSSPSPSETSTAPTSYSPSFDGSPSSTSHPPSKYHPTSTSGPHRIPAPPIPLLQPSRPAPVPSRAPSQLSSTTQKDSRHGDTASKPEAIDNKVSWSDRSRSRSLFGFRSGRRHSSRSSWGKSPASKTTRGDPKAPAKSLSTSKSLGDVESKKASQRKHQENSDKSGRVFQEVQGNPLSEPPTTSDLQRRPEAKFKSGHRKRLTLSTGQNAIAGQTTSSPSPTSTTSPARHDRRPTSPVNRSPSAFSSPRNVAPTAAATAGTITPSTSTSSRGHASVFSRTHTRSSSANTAATTPSTSSTTNMNSSTAAAAAAAAVMTSPTGFSVEPDVNPTLQTLQPEPLNVRGRTTIVPDADAITPGRTLMPSVPYSATGTNAAASSTTSLTSGGGRRLRPRGFSLTGGTSSPSASVGRLGSLTGGWTSGWTSGNGWNPGGWSNGLRATRQAPGSPVGGSCTVNPGIVTGAVSSSVVNGYGEQHSPSPSGRGKGRVRDVGNGCELDRRRERSTGRRGRSSSATPRPSPDSTVSIQSRSRKPSPPSDSSKPSPVTSPSSNTEAFPPLSATPSTTTLTPPSPLNVGSNLNKPWPPLPLHLRRRRASTPASPSRPRPLVSDDAVPFVPPPQPTGAAITPGTTPSQTPLPQTPMSTTSLSTTGTACTIRGHARDSQSSTALLLSKETAPSTSHAPSPAPPKAATAPPTGFKQPPRRSSFSSLAAREARASFQMNRRDGIEGSASNGGGGSSASGFSWRRPHVDNSARADTTSSPSSSSSTAAAGSRSVSRGRGRRSISESAGRGLSSGRASDDNYRGVGGVKREGSTRTVQAAVMPALLLLGTELFTPGKRPEDVGFGKAVAAVGAVRGVGGAGRAVGVLEVDDIDDGDDDSDGGEARGAAGMRPRAATTTAAMENNPMNRPRLRHQHTSSAFSYTYTPSPSAASSLSTSSAASHVKPHAPHPLFPSHAPKTQPSFSLLPSIPQSQPHTPIQTSPPPTNPAASHAPSKPASHTASPVPAPAPAPAPFISRLDPGSSCPFTVDATSGHFDPPGTREAGSPFRRSLSPPVKDLGREGDLMAGMEAVWRKWEMGVA